MNQPQKKGAWVTVYDVFSASVAASIPGISALLVGDSLAMTLYGDTDTKSANMPMMLRHTAAAVCGANGQARVVADFPIGTYNTPEQAVETAQAFAAIGTRSVKLEGHKPEVISALIESGFTVTGHLGLTPQTATKMSQKAKTEREQNTLRDQALDLQELGISELVLECVPAEFAASLQAELEINIIGIGCGKSTNAQVLVWADIMGMTVKSPSFATAFTDLKSTCTSALQDYVSFVQNP